MDKVNELTKSQKEDEDLLIAKLNDKIKFVKARNRFQSTDFLDPMQRSILNDIVSKNKELDYEFFGGYENAERTMLILKPDNFKEIANSKIYNQIMRIIRIVLPKEEWGKYEHKSYLGALMKLGLKREKVGDIIVRSDGADIIISKDIEEFLLQSLNGLIRFQKAEITSEDISDLKYVLPEKKIFKINVPSMRLGAIVGELARCSRNDASRLLEEERVFIDFKVEIRGTKQVKEGTQITIRGKGRFKITQILGTTRKGRYTLEVEK